MICTFEGDNFYFTVGPILCEPFVLRFEIFTELLTLRFEIFTELLTTSCWLVISCRIFRTACCLRCQENQRRRQQSAPKRP